MFWRKAINHKIIHKEISHCTGQINHYVVIHLHIDGVHEPLRARLSQYFIDAVVRLMSVPCWPSHQLGHTVTVPKASTVIHGPITTLIQTNQCSMTQLQAGPLGLLTEDADQVH
jgi:hypothetical protein